MKPRNVIVLALALSATQANAVEHRGAEPVSAPRGFVEMEVAGVVPHDEGNTVLLADKTREHFLPIGIGNTEALSIYLRMEKRRFERPLTHDLLDTVLSRFGGEVIKAHIHRVQGDVFYGTVFVRRGDEVITIDARPSDAIAMALGRGAPVFVARAVVRDAGVTPEDLVPQEPPEPPETILSL